MVTVLVDAQHRVQQHGGEGAALMAEQVYCTVQVGEEVGVAVVVHILKKYQGLAGGQGGDELGRPEASRPIIVPNVQAVTLLHQFVRTGCRVPLQEPFREGASLADHGKRGVELAAGIRCAERGDQQSGEGDAGHGVVFRSVNIPMRR